MTRGPADPPQPIFRVNGKEAIGLAISMRKGGDVLALGRNIEQAMDAITANLPVGIEPTLVADQPVTVEHAVDDFMEALWEAIAIVLGCQLRVPRRAGGHRGGGVHSAGPRRGVHGHELRHRSPAHLPRRPDHRPRPAGRRRHDHDRVHGHPAGARRHQGERGPFAYSSTAFPMLTGTLVTVAAFVPIGFARSVAGEYTFSIFAVVAIALIASWFVAALFSPLLGVWMLKKPKSAHSEPPGPLMRAVPPLSSRWRCGRAG